MTLRERIADARWYVVRKLVQVKADIIARKVDRFLGVSCPRVRVYDNQQLIRDIERELACGAATSVAVNARLYICTSSIDPLKA